MGHNKTIVYIPKAGEVVREEMYKRDMGITDIAKGTGINYWTIRDFLDYGKDISSSRLMKICAYMGMSMDYVMGLKRA